MNSSIKRLHLHCFIKIIVMTWRNAFFIRRIMMKLLRPFLILTLKLNKMAHRDSFVNASAGYFSSYVRNEIFLDFKTQFSEPFRYYCWKLLPILYLLPRSKSKAELFYFCGNITYFVGIGRSARLQVVWKFKVSTLLHTLIKIGNISCDWNHVK